MATTSDNKHNTPYPDLEAATDRVRQANERFIEASRKVTSAYIDGLERYIGGLTEFERKLGAQAQSDAVTSLFNAHAKMTDDVTSATVSVARELLAV
jgi:transposase